MHNGNTYTRHFFNLHIDKICLKSAKQLNALVGYGIFQGRKKISFNKKLCSFKFQFLSSGLDLVKAKSVHKIEAIEKDVLLFKLTKYQSCYEDLLKKPG